MPSDLPHPGELLAGYRIERQLGRGATGVVYLARQVALDRPVALKVVGGALAADPAFRERFRHEARAAAALDHPNVVTVLDSGEDDERLWLAMRLVDGPDLRVLLRRTGRLEPEHAVSIVEQVAAALDAAHAAGLVHRDVKPGNVLVEDAPGGALHAELADFGLVGGVGPDLPGGSAGSGEVEGTPEYAAPEQLAGHEATAAADVYGLGRVFAEMLTGDPVADIPPGATGFAGVVARATDPDPAWRYRSAGALAVAARAVLEPGSARGGATAAGPSAAGSTGVAGRPDRVDDPVAGAAAVGMGAGLVGAGVAGALPSPEEVADDAADAEYEDVEPLAAPRSRASRRRATTLVASTRRRRRWAWSLPVVLLLGVLAAAALFADEVRDELLAGQRSERPRTATPPVVPAPPGGATAGRGSGRGGGSASAGGSAGGSGTRGGSTGSGSGTGGSSDRAQGGAPGTDTGTSGSASGGGSPRDSAVGGDAAGAAGSGSAGGRGATGDRSGDRGAAGASTGSSAPVLDASGPGTAPSAAATPPARGMERFGGGSWALDLPADAGWRQTAVQELSGGRRLLTRLRRPDGARLIVEHQPGQTAVFGPWPGTAFAVRLPDVGRLDALLFRGGRFAMCRDGVCGAVAVNGPSGGVLLLASAATDAAARRELRRSARGLRVG